MATPDALLHWAGPMTAVLSGAALGAIFFGGLQWTVRRLATFRRPGLAVFTGLMLRMGITLGGFYAVADGQWQRLLLCLSGFIVARVVATWLMHSQARAHHEP